MSDIQFHWFLLNHYEDVRENIDENVEYIKALNMRLRPETCPELHEEEGASKTMKIPDEEFERIISSHQDPKYLVKNDA